MLDPLNVIWKTCKESDVYWIPQKSKSHIWEDERNATFEIKPLFENELSNDDKKKLIADITDVLVRFWGENLHNNIWVVIQEEKTGNFEVGRQVITLETVKALRAGKGSL